MIKTKALTLIQKKALEVFVTSPLVYIVSLLAPVKKQTIKISM